MIKWLIIWWKHSEIKALLIFGFQLINSIRYLRQKLVLIFGIIWMLGFFKCFGFYETLYVFFFFWEISGPQVEKYQDHHVKDHLDPDSKDYIKRDEGEERL